MSSVDIVALIPMHGLFGSVLLWINTASILSIDLRQAKLCRHVLLICVVSSSISAVIHVSVPCSQIVCMSNSFKGYNRNAFFLQNFRKFVFQIQFKQNKVFLSESLLVNKSIEFFVDYNLNTD